MKLKTTLAAAAAAAAAAFLSGAAFAEDCKPSKWGADDEIGAANYVTPEQVLKAAALVKQGKNHPLGIVIGSDTPAFPPRSLSLQVLAPNQNNGRSLAGDLGWDIVYNDDITQLWWGIGPQIDGLGHLGERGVYYNCNSSEDFVRVTGLTKLSVDKIPPMIGRGVLIDMAKHKGVKSMQAGDAISSADLKAAMAA